MSFNLYAEGHKPVTVNHNVAQAAIDYSKLTGKDVVVCQYSKNIGDKCVKDHYIKTVRRYKMKMKFKVSRHFGMFQFWHMDCKNNTKESAMYAPKKIDESTEKMRCAGCDNEGVAYTSDLQSGYGETI